MKRHLKCGRRKVEGGGDFVERRRCTFPIPHSAVRLRSAVTLIELLITMVIMAILAAAILGTASAAMEAGRRSRTESTITKIHSLLMERLASYEIRRVEFNTKVNDALAEGFSRYQADTQKYRGEAVADMRLLGLRELVKYEMPDRWSDFQATPVVLENPPALARLYQRRHSALRASASDILQHQGAECLYMVVMFATGDGEARTLFRPQEIGDVDEDGAPEFLDGWGQPISWLRWPAGFASDLQPIDQTTGLPMPDVDHDPLDVYQRDQPGIKHTRPTRPGWPSPVETALKQMESRGVGAYRLVPLIFSIGPDGASGVNTKADTYVAGLDPYDPGNSTQAGSISNRDESLDNITNHLIEY